MTAMPVIYLRSDAALAECAEGWLRRPFITLDTEFMRVRTFYPDAALFQVCDGETAFLIDPLDIRDLQPLAAVLRSPGVLKVMHSCSEDLEVCDRHLKALPEPLFDTQIAGAFCGLGLSMGYQRMLETVLGLSLEKSETRTDWLQRPLSDAQQRYAADDVIHLCGLFDALQQRLHGREAAEWVRLECMDVLARFRARDPGGEFAGVNGAWRLEGTSLAVLRDVYRWREDTARERNLPKNWVAPDRSLIQIAQRRPTSVAQLADIEDFPPGSVRRHGPALLECVEASSAIAPAQCPTALPKPLSPAQTKLFKRLKAVVTECAERLGIAPEMIARKRDIEDLVRRGAASDCALLGGWRRQQCGEAVLAELGAAA